MSENPMFGPLNIVVALSCEARPLIHRFGMRQISQTGFRIYQNDHNVTLIVTGVGKLAVATACGFLAGMNRNVDSVAAWLNVGIAGHRSAQAGELLWINKIVNQATADTYYPPLLLKLDCTTGTVITVASPELEYGLDAAYDMEAASFYPTATRFATTELVQVLKIVSDNPQASVDRITEVAVSEWIENRLDPIEKLMNQLRTLAGEYNHLYTMPDEFKSLLQRVRASATQRAQLKAAYRRFYASGGADLSSRLDAQAFRSARHLQESIQAISKYL